MPSTRLEAFSDGVLAIIITIMVLELHTPDGDTLGALLKHTGPSLLTYLLSFVYVGIYWNNHHHLFQVCSEVNGAVLWANLGLLFSLSLYPFTTSWMDKSGLARTPVVVYGVNLLLSAVAFTLLQTAMTRVPGQRERMERVFGRNAKGMLSLVLYVVGGLAAALLPPWVGLLPFVAVAAIWLVPDTRVERYLAQEQA